MSPLHELINLLGHSRIRATAPGSEATHSSPIAISYPYALPFGRCLGVWEEWLIREPNPSFANYLAGPVKSYFLSQCLFEKDGTWRFGDRSHERGILEAYADVLQLEPDHKRVDAYLAILSQQWPKGHWPCPCGSGQRIRMCHRAQLDDLHRRIPPDMAGRMLSRLRQSLEP